MSAPSPRIVLARPRIGANIGFVARLCANFELETLVLVAPAPDYLDGASCTASMCREHLDSARVVGSLDAALGDCTHVFGLTARRGRDRLVRPLQHLGSQVAELPDDARPALVFGNESSGLDAQETAQCTMLLRAELPGMHSLNLSHAVSLALWEWFRARPSSEPGTKRPSFTSRTERERLAERTHDVLERARFRAHEPHLAGSLQRLIRTHALQARDARMIHRVLTHIEWLLEHGSTRVVDDDVVEER